MARLNEDQGGNSAKEALKLRFLRQNREITRSNSAQSIRLHNLQVQNTDLLTENMSLRVQVNHLQVQLDRHDKERKIIEKTQMTQRKLQNKVAELDLLLKELNQSPILSPQGKRTTLDDDDDRSPTLESRLLHNSYVPGEGLEGFLPAIEEECRRNSFNSEHGRNSFNFADIELPPPAPEPHDIMSDEDDSPPPPPMNNVESRPRRRRDSYYIRPVDPLPEPIPEPTKSAPTPAKLPKRKFADKDSDPLPTSPELSFRFSKVSEKAGETARRKMEAGALSPHINNEEDGDIDMADPGPMDCQLDRSIMLKGSHGRPPSSNGNINLVGARKALGPKSTNSDPVNSPTKSAARNEKGAPGYPEKVTDIAMECHPPASARSYRGSVIRDKDTPPPDTDPEAVVTSRRPTRRARPTMSYAEPKLGTKLRREAGLVDAVTGEGKKRMASTSSTSRKRTPNRGIKIKDNTDPVMNWVDIPAMEPKVRFEDDEAEDTTKSRTTAEEYIQEQTNFPPSIPTSRKRRTSSLVSSLVGIHATEPVDLKRKVDFRELEETERGRSSRRLIYRPQPPSPSESPVGEEEEDVQGRRNTLSTSEIRKAVRMKSSSTLDEDTTRVGLREEEEHDGLMG